MQGWGWGGGGVVLTSPKGFKLYHALVFTFNPTNNEAEYEALIGGIRLAKQLEAEKLKIRLDSRLVVRQMTGQFETLKKKMAKYKEMVTELLQTQ